VPLTIADSKLHKLLSSFSGQDTAPDLSDWKKIVQQQMSRPKKVVRIGLVAKYMDNEDTYLSVIEAIKAAVWHEKVSVDIRWIDAEAATERDFAEVNALLVPGGFGERGVEGKIAAARYALENNVPYLGICLGLQVAVIAAARRAGLKNAHSSEFSDTDQNVVYIMNGQAGKESTGGTLRLGDYTAQLVAGSLAENLYGSHVVTERHRHRYEVNQKFVREMQSGGIEITGTSPDGTLVEFVEAPANTFFIATQAHPEFRSRPTRAHPLFLGFVRAALYKSK